MLVPPPETYVSLYFVSFACETISPETVTASSSIASRTIKQMPLAAFGCVLAVRVLQSAVCLGCWANLWGGSFLCLVREGGERWKGL